MDINLYNKVSRWFDEHAENMIDDIMRLVRIESVSNPDSQDKPFGAGCRQCMDEMLRMGREHGFYTENYEYYVGSIGEQEKNWDNMIGFWNHLDVVPVGNDWDYEPFSPVRKKQFIIGRGSQDNKGPAVGILYMMKCIRELNIKLNHELCLFVGCDEERGMSDIEYYTEHYKTPRMSMIADSGFPVCYGEKGIIEGRMITKHKQQVPDCIKDFWGGSAGNMIPDLAYIVFERNEALEGELELLLGADNKLYDCCGYEVNGSEICITAHGLGKHSAFPEGSRNAIHELAVLVADLKNVDDAVRKLFENVSHLSEEYYGKNFDIEYSDDISGKTTCAATLLRYESGRLLLTYNIRYAITDEAERICAAMAKCADKYDMCWETESESAPNYFPKEHKAVELLTNVYNEITGETKESFVMGGGTYARKLPNAFAYGVGGMKNSKEDNEAKAEIFRHGHGGAHEPDEGLNVRLLLEAMKIYTMAVIELNECEL